MTTDADKTRALEAERLLNDDTLNEALAAMRAEALEKLVKADPSEFSAVALAQCRVAAVDDFRTALQRFYLKGQERKARSIA